MQPGANSATDRSVFQIPAITSVHLQPWNHRIFMAGALSKRCKKGWGSGATYQQPWPVVTHTWPIHGNQPTSRMESNTGESSGTVPPSICVGPKPGRVSSTDQSNIVGCGERSWASINNCLQKSSSLAKSSPTSVFLARLPYTRAFPGLRISGRRHWRRRSPRRGCAEPKADNCQHT